MTKLRLIIFLSILIIVIWPERSLAPTLEEFSSANDRLQLMNDIVADFQFLNSLLGDVYNCDQYLLTSHANMDSAASYLAQGFDYTLAATIAAYYLVYLPDFDRVAVVPTDSIPIITTADTTCLRIHRLSPQQVVIDRFYRDCYLPGDLYHYQITAKYNGERWIITDLSLSPSSSLL